MTDLCLTLAELNKLRPCAESGSRVRAALRKMNSDKAHCFTAAEARDAGCTFDDIIWAAAALARTDKNVDRKLRLWMADCAARVLHIYERDYPTDDRPRNAIKASRDFANGKIATAAWDAARDAARAAARDAVRDAAWDAVRAAARAAAWDAAWDAENQWQFARLIEWLGESEPRPLRLPPKPKMLRDAA